MYLVKRANGNPQRFSGKPMGDLAYPGVISGKICQLNKSKSSIVASAAALVVKQITYWSIATNKS